MPRRLWEQAELTTADQMNELTREAAQRFSTTAEADGAYDPTIPPVAGQVRMITGQPAPERPVEADGRLGSARPINEFSLERFTGDQWIDDAILFQPLEIGWAVSAVTAAEPPPGSGETATLIVRLILNRAAGINGVTAYITTTNGTATAPEDYVAKTREAIQIPHRATEADVAFTINASAAADAPETFTAQIVAVSEGTLGSSNAAGYQTDTLTVTIAGLTSDVVITAADTTVTEGNKANIVITANRAASQPVTGSWSATPALDIPSLLRAREGQNFQQPSLSQRRWSIPAGMTTTTVQLDTINTATVDPGFQVDVALTDLAVSGADNIAASGNDLTARVSINDTTPPTPGVILSGPAIGRIGEAFSTDATDTITGGATTDGIRDANSFRTDRSSNTFVVWDWVMVLGWVSSYTATPIRQTYYWRVAGYGYMPIGRTSGTTIVTNPGENISRYPNTDQVISTGYHGTLQNGVAGVLRPPTTTIRAVRALSSDYDFDFSRVRYVYRWWGNIRNATAN